MDKKEMLLRKTGDCGRSTLHSVALRREPAFTLLELVGTVTLLAVGLISTAGVYVSVSNQVEQTEDQNAILSDMKDLVEQIRGTGPAYITSTFDGALYEVAAGKLSLVSQKSTGYSPPPEVNVQVDATNPKLLDVTMVGTWQSAGDTNTVTVNTKIHNPDGELK